MRHALLPEFGRQKPALIRAPNLWSDSTTLPLVQVDRQDVVAWRLSLALQFDSRSAKSARSCPEPQAQRACSNSRNTPTREMHPRSHIPPDLPGPWLQGPRSNACPDHDVPALSPMTP